jgi:hypothetical protein
MKLTEILDEIKINKPSSQKEILDKLVKLNNSLLLDNLSKSESINDFIKEWNSIEQILRDEYGYDYEEPDFLENIINLIENYFRYFQKNDIYVFSGITNSNLKNFNLPRKYSKIIIDYDEGNEENYIILYN